MSMASAVIASSAKRAFRKLRPISKYLHLQNEKKKLEFELTTNFPAEANIIFDENLDLLMMNGSYFYFNHDI